MGYFWLKKDLVAGGAAVAFGWAAAFVRKYVFSDVEFAVFLMVLISLDTVTGVIAAKKTGTFSSKRLGRVVWKAGGYVVVLSAIHVATHYTVMGKKNDFLSGVMLHADAIMYAFVVFRELISIDENCSKAFGVGVFPPLIRQKIDDFFKGKNNGANDKSA